MIATVACIAGLLRLITAATSDTTTFLIVAGCLLIAAVSGSVAVIEGRQHYRRLCAFPVLTLEKYAEHGGGIDLPPVFGPVIS